MDKNNIDRTSEAAEQMTEAFRGSYEAIVEGTAAVHESNARLVRSFFDNYIEALREQAESNAATVEALGQQAQNQQEALRDLSRESVSAYAGFLGSMCSYYDELLGEAPEETGK